MRRVGVVLCGIAVLVVLAGGCAKEPYFRGGDPVTLEKAIPLEQVKANPRSFEGKKVLVEGTVAGVCKGMGCWALVETSPSGESIYAKSVDHSVSLPKDCEGSWIRVEGEVVVVEPGEKKEKACDGEGHAEGGEAHTCPQPDCFVSLAAVELIKK